MTRLDAALVERGLVPTRSRARRLVGEGAVTVDDAVVRRPAARVGESTRLAVDPHAARWVSRGAHKLEGGLQAFGVDPRGKVCLDVGASTGGFTQVLLLMGATRVIAVDVGHGQLADELHRDARVVLYEGTDVREFDGAAAGGPFPLVVVDVSFIPVCIVAPHLARCTGPDGDLVILVKPQFELGPDRVASGGIVRSAAFRDEALHRACSCLEAAGLTVRETMHAPVAGAGGNVEWLVHAVKEQP